MPGPLTLERFLPVSKLANQCAAKVEYEGGRGLPTAEISQSDEADNPQIQIGQRTKACPTIGLDPQPNAG